MTVGLDGALGIATGGLAAINQGFAIISQNVANANTAGYATEQTTQTAQVAQDQGLGVRVGPAQLVQDQALQNQVRGQSAEAAYAQGISAALQNLQPVLGTVGAGDDLGSLLNGVQTSFSALLNDPSSQAQQGAVVNAAQALTGKINTLGSAYGQARQAAQTTIENDVSTLNTALRNIGGISDQIIALQAQGRSTAALENQRNQQIATISGLVPAQFITLPNGDMQVYSRGGAQSPTPRPGLSVASPQTGPTQY